MGGGGVLKIASHSIVATMKYLPDRYNIYVLISNAALALLRINGESGQRYISVSIAKNSGEFNANLRAATYEMYVYRFCNESTAFA